ncbi:MAG: hypothetical protein ABI706_11015 [Ilumatobacteraceae bacterium]
MNTAAKLAVFAAAIAVTFGGAMAVGSAVGPIDVSGGGSSHSAHSADAPAGDFPRGLAVAQDGYRFVPEAGPLGGGILAAETATTFAFRIVDTDAAPITDFEQLHERPLHLIVLSRNLVDYLHLHPTMDAAGRWTVDLPALAPGSYRMYADFQPSGGDNLTLGTDFAVPGNVAATALPEPSTSESVDGYTVTLAGTPMVGEAALTFTVDLDGSTVHTDPYLGAAGHLVAIRAGDLAYLHVHPNSTPTDVAETFLGEFPSAGTYRLFFDFSHNGTVHTAAFTVEVPEGTAATAMTDSEGH